LQLLRSSFLVPAERVPPAASLDLAAELAYHKEGNTRIATGAEGNIKGPLAERRMQYWVYAGCGLEDQAPASLDGAGATATIAMFADVHAMIMEERAVGDGATTER
jgi:hypothetical protein